MKFLLHWTVIAFPIHLSWYVYHFVTQIIITLFFDFSCGMSKFVYVASYAFWPTIDLVIVTVPSNTIGWYCTHYFNNLAELFFPLHNVIWILFFSDYVYLRIAFIYFQGKLKVGQIQMLIINIISNFYSNFLSCIGMNQNVEKHI